MRRDTNKRWPPPPGVACWATGNLQGVLHAHPTSLPNFCRAEVEVGDQLFPVFAHNELAEQLGTLPAGQAVRLTGILQIRSWPSGGNKDRGQCCLNIDNIIVLPRSLELCPKI